MDAAEAEKRGLVSKVVPAGQLVETVIAVAEKIASNSKLINQVSAVLMYWRNAYKMSVIIHELNLLLVK